jgi:hypothetical protein
MLCFSSYFTFFSENLCHFACLKLIIINLHIKMNIYEIEFYDIFLKSFYESIFFFFIFIGKNFHTK